MQDGEGQETPLPAGFLPTESSNIKGIAFFLGQENVTPDPKSRLIQAGELQVVFHNGTRYRYEGVPGQLYWEMREAESVGRFFNQNIKGQDQYASFKVEPQTETEQANG